MNNNSRSNYNAYLEINVLKFGLTKMHLMHFFVKSLLYHRNSLPIEAH